MTPMAEEAAQFRASMTDVRESRLAGLPLLEGRLDGVACRLVQSGIGKVSAASAAQALLHIAPGDPILVLGIGGGITDEAHLGDVVVATQSAQHDLDPRPFYPRHYVPHLEMSMFTADLALAEAARQAAERVAPRFLHARPAYLKDTLPQVFLGTFVTGDQVITAKRKRGALRWDFPDAVCVDMETAAVAQVCRQNGGRWGAVRVISDGTRDTRIISSQVLAYTMNVATVFLRETAAETLRALAGTRTSG